MTSEDSISKVSPPSLRDMHIVPNGVFLGFLNTFYDISGVCDISGY